MSRIPEPIRKFFFVKCPACGRRFWNYHGFEVINCKHHYMVEHYKPETPAERWLRQEHNRRVERLGEHRTEEWETLVAQSAIEEGPRTGYLPQYKVLQIMEDIYRMGLVDAHHPLERK